MNIIKKGDGVKFLNVIFMFCITGYISTVSSMIKQDTLEEVKREAEVCECVLPASDQGATEAPIVLPDIPTNLCMDYRH